MTRTVLKVGQQSFQEDELYPLLAQYQLLPRLAREIIVDQAIADIECTPEEENAIKEQFFQQAQISNQEQFLAWLKLNGMTEEQFNKFIVRDLKLEKFKQAEWEDHLESYFLECKNQLDRVVYSLIRTREAGIAQELYFRIQEEESSFADLARQYSEGGEAQTGGLVGPVELNVPHPQIAQMLMTGSVGKVYPPTPIGDWWVILRLEQYLSAQLDHQVRQRLRNDLFQKWLMEKMQQQVSFILPDTEALSLATENAENYYSLK